MSIPLPTRRDRGIRERRSYLSTGGSGGDPPLWVLVQIGFLGSRGYFDGGEEHKLTRFVSARNTVTEGTHGCTVLVNLVLFLSRDFPGSPPGISQSACREAKNNNFGLDLPAPIFFHKFVKTFPQLRDHVKLDDFGCNGSFAHVNARKVLQKNILGLYDLSAHVNMV